MSDLLLMRGSPLRSILSTSGLVAAYLPYMDVVGKNILPVGSADGSDPSKWGIYMWDNVASITTGRPDPDGGTSAFRVTNSVVGENSIKFGGPVLTLYGTVCAGLWIKSNKSGQKWGISSIDTTMVGSEWQYISATKASSGSCRLYFTSPAPDEGIDIEIYQPQTNLGQLYDYSAPVGLSQSVVDRSGLGNTVQRGSTSGADTNDPSWSPVSLYFDGVDDVVANEPVADYALYAWGATNSALGWVSEIPATAGYWFGGIRMSRTPGASEEARLKANIATLLAGQGVTIA